MYLLSVDTLSSSKSAVNSMDAKTILSFFSGGAIGSIITIFYNRFKGRIQEMKCFYVDDDVISRLPMTTNEGEHIRTFSRNNLF